jgi:uncharacterized OB-fold protein
MEVSVCKCGKKVPFKRKICPYCGKTMSFVEIRNSAEILTYTTLYTVPEGFDAPINLVLVELENGANLLCVCKNEKDLEIGKKGKIVLVKDKYYFMGKG